MNACLMAAQPGQFELVSHPENGISIENEVLESLGCEIEYEDEV